MNRKRPIGRAFAAKASDITTSERNWLLFYTEAGASGYLSNPTTSAFFNVSAYNVPAHPVDASGTAEPIGRFGNCGVGILEGPGTATFSMSAGKTFHLNERFGLRYEAQFSNLFNLANWGLPNMNITGKFGLISSSQEVAQAGPRTIQMSLRFQF
ncbi:MAG: hypothetical protein ABSC21_18060 [Terriglobia bacterium]